MEAEERCLICGSDPSEIALRNLTDPFPHSEQTKSKNHLESGSRVLSAQLSVLFVLRKVLRLERQFVADILEQTGEHPSTWNLKLCQVCYRIVEESNFVFERLRKLNVEFEDLSKRLCIKLFKSKRSNETISEVIHTEVTKRKPGRPKRTHRGKKKEENLSETLDGSVEEKSRSVTLKIRQQVFKHAGKYSVQSDERLPFERVPAEEHFPRPSIPVPVPAPIPPIHQKYAIKVEISKPSEDEDLLIDELIDLDTTHSNTNVDVDDEGAPVDDSHGDDYYEPPEPMDTANGVYQDDTADDDREDKDNEDPSDDDEDSDFEISSRSRRKRGRPSIPGRRKRKPVTDPGLIAKSVQLANSNSFICPKCHEIFSSATMCDDHILNEHYGGKWPKPFSCDLCTDLNFRGENMLRLHYNTAHPGLKLPNDLEIEQSVEKGAMPELTYEVIPLGFKTTFPNEPAKMSISDEDHPDAVNLINRTLEEPPTNAFSIPVIAQGQIRYLVLPTRMKKLPPEVLALIQTGLEDKSCPYNECTHHFPTEIQLRAHIKRVHEGEEFPYDCPMCDQKFERIGKTMIHIQRKHILAENACDICGMYFKESILLLAHVQRNHFGVDNPYKCIKCEVRYPRRSILNKHLKKVHKVQIVSYQLLNKKPNKVKDPNVKRKRRKKEEKKHVCETCVKEGNRKMVFFSAEDLDSHIKRRHLGIPRPYPCPICKKRYSKPSLVEEHLKVLHTVRNDWNVDDAQDPSTRNSSFVCVPCNKQFKNQFLLNVHLRGKNHSEQGTYVCEICSQGFYGLKYLQNHQSQKHHQELNIDPYKCKHCDKILSSSRSLREHIELKHTKTARLKCPYCETRFHHESTMDQHVNSLHTKAEQFLCPECPKTFLKDFYLKNHIARVHSGKKPHVCNVCQKQFSDKPTYNRHVESHSSIIHSCLHCGKSGFKTRHSLRVHMKTFHKEELAEEDRQKKLAQLALPEKEESPNDIPTPSSENTIASSKVETLPCHEDLPTLDCFAVKTDPLEC